MNENWVFTKTAKGVSEVSTRAGALSLAARRVLIMIDGKRTVGDLAPLMRAGEVEGILSALEAQGFISRKQAMAEGPATLSSTSPAVAPPPQAPVAAAAPPPLPLEISTVGGGETDERNLVTLEEAKRRAVRELVDRLGPDGELMSMRIEQCSTADLLRDRVREAERLIAGLLGDEAAADYLRSLRQSKR